MSLRTDELLPASPPEWTHRTVLDCHPAGGLARAFVSHHLVAHRLFHLVDIAGVVAVKLATDSVVLCRTRLIVTLSKAETVVLLRVEDTTDEGLATQEPPDAVIDARCGSGVVGLLTLQWGVTREAGETRGLWATFDARRHRHAVATVEDSMTFTRDRIPMARGPGGPGGGPVRRQSPRNESSMQ